jgi:hypothetical protein
MPGMLHNGNAIHGGLTEAVQEYLHQCSRILVFDEGNKILFSTFQVSFEATCGIRVPPHSALRTLLGWAAG